MATDLASLAPAARFAPDACPRLVLKIGSSLLVRDDGTVRRDWLAGLLGDVAQRVRAGQQVIIVSSGAVALGARRLGMARGGRGTLEDSQAAAAVGQIELAQTYAELLRGLGLGAAQLLLTLEDLENRRRYLNITDTIDRLLAAQVVPVINENDTVVTAEIRFGDNDRLAARVAQACEAGGVILLSDVDGLLTADPRSNADARLIPVVEAVTPEVEALAGAARAMGMGSGGMVSKLEAAKIATGGATDMAIINGTVDAPLARFAQQGIGTVFLARRDAPSPRKRWLAGRIRVDGTLTVDAGALAALKDGASLLPVGVVRVEGDFARGDVVDIRGEDGRVAARGLVRYDASDARRICRRKTADIAGILGYAPRSAMVHMDDMVLKR